MRLPYALLLAAGLALAPGCARNNYLTNRGGDLVDILRGHVMFGPGVAAKVEVTQALQLGGTFEHRVFAAGLYSRGLGVWRESLWGWGLLFGWHSEHTVTGIPAVSGTYGWAFAGGQDGSEGVFKLSDQGDSLDLFNLRATVMLALGIDIELRLGEVFDFLAGIFQFDPAGDDRDYEAMRRSEAASDSDELDAG